MSDYPVLWQQIQDTYSTIGDNHIRPIMQKKFDTSPLCQLNGWYIYGLAYDIAPKPLTLAQLQIRNAYYKKEALEGFIQNLKDAGFLDDNGFVTPESVEYTNLVDAQNDVLDDLSQRYQGDIVRAKSLIRRVLEKALTLNDAPCLKEAVREHIDNWSDFHQVYFMLQRAYVFRDDAHLNAWRHLDLDSRTYEAWSLVWDGTANTAVKLAEARPNRGYTLEEWQEAYDALVEKGWLKAEGNGTYSITDESKPIRDDIEAKTDEYFYSVFSVLTDEEVHELTTLLNDMQELYTPEPEAS